MPFSTQELYQENGLYYGLNALSHNLILVNRKSLKTPSGFILGTPGSGKSFKAKTDNEFKIFIPQEQITLKLNFLAK